MENFSIKPWRIDYSGHEATKSILNVPRVVYRYVRIKWAEEILRKKQLWFSSPNAFNDPFDMYGGLIDLKINYRQAKEFVSRNKPDFNRSEKKEYAADMLKRKDTLMAYQRSLFDEQKSSSGVCCFSELHDSPLMWSHYADSHRGVVIGFNIEPVYTTGNFFFLQPVNYSDHIQPKSYYDAKHEALQYWILTKSKIWSYEREVRAFLLNQNGNVDFDPICIKEIYLGCKISDIDRQRLLDLVDPMLSRGVSLRAMEIDPKTFGLKASILS